jgi:hypothetical protein
MEMNSDLDTLHNVDLKRVENRLKTFDNWPIGFIDKNDLASAGKIFIFIKLAKLAPSRSLLGFYYLNNSDQVRCVECGGVIGQWEQGLKAKIGNRHCRT